MSWGMMIFGEIKFPLAANNNTYEEWQAMAVKPDGQLSPDDTLFQFQPTNVKKVLTECGQHLQLHPKKSNQKMVVKITGAMSEDDWREHGGKLATALALSEKKGAEGKIYFVEDTVNCAYELTIKTQAPKWEELGQTAATRLLQGKEGAAILNTAKPHKKVKSAPKYLDGNTPSREKICQLIDSDVQKALPMLEKYLESPTDPDSLFPLVVYAIAKANPHKVYDQLSKYLQGPKGSTILQVMAYEKRGVAPAWPHLNLDHYHPEGWIKQDSRWAEQCVVILNKVLSSMHGAALEALTITGDPRTPDYIIKMIGKIGFWQIINKFPYIQNKKYIPALKEAMERLNEKSNQQELAAFIASLERGQKYEPSF